VGTGALVAGAGALVAGAGAVVGVAAGAQPLRINPNKVRTVMILAIFFISFILLDQTRSN
jgi:phage shock protein PspC (stress-responsive transcriptional regulator)